MAIKVYKKDSTAKLSANFKVREIACKGQGCCSTVKVDTKLVEFLQKIREHFGKAVVINSGYRCSKHNKAVGGASGSYHTKGMAADIVVKDVKPAEVAKYAESIGVLGIGLYEANDGNFVHIDTRPNKSFWYGHKQAYRSTFGGENIVKKWQKAAIADGFKLASGADGIWGKECEAVAKKAICKRCYWPWKNKSLTTFYQALLGIDADGKFGAGTKAAVVNYQKAHGLVADGIIGINTVKSLLNI
jgi:hypothetical protein